LIHIMFMLETSRGATRASCLSAAFVFLAVFGLSGCAPVAHRPGDHPRPTRPSVPAVEPAPAPVEPAPPVPKPRADVPLKPASPAVIALMQEAEADRTGGRLDNAAATLERAIRIQPRNPELWRQLAAIRLQQGQPGMAEDLAKKSNVLAKGNRLLTRQNWSLIAEARRLKGDMQGAADAEARARGY
jgi:hypothetical protein